jgi:hypothetical protein
MTTQDWQLLLAKINEQVLEDETFQAEDFITQAQRTAGWVGKPASTEAELEVLERRLLCKLPPSYRNFLATSNGFGPISFFIYDLCSTDEVNWLVQEDPELIEIWEEDPALFADDPNLNDDPYLCYDNLPPEGVIRPGHMRQCLMISHWGDAGFLALNPAQQHEGEWEAWHFANWMPGAQRYRSFAELMQNSYQTYVELRKENK